MKLSYKKLWKLLIDRGIKKGDLREMAQISQSTMAKLAKDEVVNTSIIIKICTVLDCDVGDISEIAISSENEENKDDQ